MFRFSEYEVDTVRLELRRGGRLVKLQRRPCELLLFLIEKQGAIVTREQIAERLWGDAVHVDAEHNINTIIRKIRHALRDDAERQRYVQTVVGRGYRFIAEVSYTDASELSRSAPSTIYAAEQAVTQITEEPDSTSRDITPDLDNDMEASPPVVTDRPWKVRIDRFWKWATVPVIGICFFAAIVLWRSQHSTAKSSQSAASQHGAAIPGPNKNPGAQHDAARTDYLRGRYFWNKRTLEGLEKSIKYYRQALKLDPDYADAYAGLGDAYVILSSYGGPEPSQCLKIARESATRALQLNPQLGGAHTVLAAVKVDLDWDWYGALNEYQKAILLSPQYPTAHHWYALHLSRLGRHAEAESEIQQALQLDPLSLIIDTDAAEIAYRAGDLPLATAYLQKAIELDPNFADAHMIWGEVNEQKKQLASAIQEFSIAEKLFHGAPNIVALEGHAFGLSGQHARGLKIAHDLEDLSKRRYVSGVDIAIVYSGLADCRNTMKWLDRAYEYRDKGLNILAADPLFNACRGDPRFTDLLTRLHLPVIKVSGSPAAVPGR